MVLILLLLLMEVRLLPEVNLQIQNLLKYVQEQVEALLVMMVFRMETKQE